MNRNYAGKALHPFSKYTGHIVLEKPRSQTLDDVQQPQKLDEAQKAQNKFPFGPQGCENRRCATSGFGSVIKTLGDIDGDGFPGAFSFALIALAADRTLLF